MVEYANPNCPDCHGSDKPTVAGNVFCHCSGKGDLLALAAAFYKAAYVSKGIGGPWVRTDLSLETWLREVGDTGKPGQVVKPPRPAMAALFRRHGGSPMLLSAQRRASVACEKCDGDGVYPDTNDADSLVICACVAGKR